MKHAAALSFYLHFGILVFFASLKWFFPSTPASTQKIKVEIKEVLQEQPTTKITAPEIQLNKTPPAPPPPTPPKKVFGLNKNTLQGNAGAAVEVKAGNTLAKEIDQEKINPEDADPLPIPVDDYLVTQMPRLKSEVRIPYPAEARKKNIEGAVIMDILIDEKGKVRTAVLVEGPGYGLNEAALSAIYQFEFAPAIIEKKPVAVKIRYSYRFVLN